MRYLIILLLSTLVACAPAREPGRQPRANPEENARLLIQSGDYAAAATEYLKLANRDRRNATSYRLKALAAYIEAGLYDEANQVLLKTEVPENDALQVAQQQILAARLKLEVGRPDEALNRLKRVSEPGLPQGLQLTYRRIFARAYFADGDYLNAANEYIRIHSYLTTPAEIDKNSQSLWNVIETIPASELDELRISGSSELSGWLELASIYQQYRYRPEKLKNVVAGWGQKHPGHAAHSSIIPALLDNSDRLAGKPTKIGLLLPFSEQYRQASTAIRDGFLAAWFQTQGEKPGEKPEIAIYDTNSLNIVETYQQAIDDGVDFIVGPLEKEAIKRLAEQADLPVKTLALNRHDQNTERTDNNLVQFGLAPEDEAIQIAETAMSDGHTLALVLTPNIPWGQRIGDAFKKRWVELGGAVLEHVNFDNSVKDFATPVKQILNIDSSEQRGRDLRSRLNRKIHHVERRRQDVDCIFAVAVPGDARQLFPQLKFHRAGDIPVYSTSHIYSGVEDVTRDGDLDGVMFVDMPWILETSRQLSLIQDALNRNWSQDKSNYRRLYALGVDTYHLIPQIGRLGAEKNSYFDGETGDLTITTGNIVKRKLRRAQFVAGKPVLLN